MGTLLTCTWLVPGEDLDFHYNVNVKGVFYCYRAAARVMIPAGYGRIIGACSIAGKQSKRSLGLKQHLVHKTPEFYSNTNIRSVLHEQSCDAKLNAYSCPRVGSFWSDSQRLRTWRC